MINQMHFAGNHAQLGNV